MKLIIAVLMLALTTFAQNTTHKTEILYGCNCDSIVTVWSANDANQLLGWDRNPFDSNKPREFRYNDGKLVLIIGYWFNGNVHEVIQIKNNVFDGVQIGFYENGTISAMITWKKGYIQ